MRRILGYIAAASAAVLMSGFLRSGDAAAQIYTVPAERLDSIANPALASDSRLMEFASRKITAEGIKEGDRPVYEFVFVNRWDRPLVIHRLSSSCGCAVPSCGKKVVASGESGAISVEYHPEGHPGRFCRRIFVYTNMADDCPSAMLELEVTVLPSQDRSGRFPVSMGKIRMKAGCHTFRSDMKDIVELAFLNVSDSPVTPVPMAEMLPPYLKAWCDTPSVKPGEEGRLSISFDPEAYGAFVSEYGPAKSLPLMLGGVGVSPKSASIVIDID